MVSKQFRMPSGRVGDSAVIVDSSSPSIRWPLKDVVASCCGDVGGHISILIFLMSLKSNELYLGNELFKRGLMKLFHFWGEIVLG